MALNKRRLATTDLEITTVGFGAWAIGGGGWAYGALRRLPEGRVLGGAQARQVERMTAHPEAHVREPLPAERRGPIPSGASPGALALPKGDGALCAPLAGSPGACEKRGELGTDASNRGDDRGEGDGNSEFPEENTHAPLLQRSRSTDPLHGRKVIHVATRSALALRPHRDPLGRPRLGCPRATDALASRSGMGPAPDVLPTVEVRTVGRGGRGAVATWQLTATARWRPWIRLPRSRGSHSLRASRARRWSFCRPTRRAKLVRTIVRMPDCERSRDERLIVDPSVSRLDDRDDGYAPSAKLIARIPPSRRVARQ